MNMKSLNPEATAMLVRFLDRLGEARSITLPLHGFFPIKISQGDTVSIVDKKGVLYSIGRMYRTDEPAYQPLLKIIVTGLHTASAHKPRIHAFPYSFRDDHNGIKEEACTILAGVVTDCIPRTQAAHVRFIHRWLKKMIGLGYVEGIQHSITF
jgi:hypothetical protein